MDLETLVAEREIARAIHAFARAMDARDWGALDAVLVADATADLGMGPVKGRAAIVAFMRTFLDDCGPTQHLIGNLDVDVDGDRATSRCYVSDTHQGAGAKAHLTFSTLGEYHDDWARLDGRWWLVHRRKLNRAHIGSIEVLGPGPR
ncbi:MAG: nuclear transport factor 2 family protein [Steroidobacteraceae bacterium]